jgi:hypothetical protein
MTQYIRKLEIKQNIIKKNYVEENAKSFISKKFGKNNNSLYTLNFYKLIQYIWNLLKIRSLNKIPSKELNIILELFAAHTHTYRNIFWWYKPNHHSGIFPQKTKDTS